MEEEDTDLPTIHQHLQTHSIKHESTSDEDCSGEDSQNQNAGKEQSRDESINILTDECNETQTTKVERLREEFVKLCGDILEKFNPSVPAMKKALAYLKTIKTEEQCETMLNNLGRNISLQGNVAARIQHFRSIAPKLIKTTNPLLLVYR